MDTIPSTAKENLKLHHLLQRCLQGDRRASSELYARYSSFLYGVVRRYVKDPEVAQEIHHDTFMRIFEKLEQYQFQGAWEGWMRTICLRQISNHFRKKINRQNITTEVKEEHAYMEAEGLSLLSQKELLQMIHELPDTQRLVFNLFVFENYAHKEIAQQLDITENNSRWQLNDARRRLKEKLVLNSRFRSNGQG